MNTIGVIIKFVVFGRVIEKKGVEEEHKKKLDEAVERWQKRKAEREKRGFKLDQFLRTGEKVPITDETTQTKHE